MQADIIRSVFIAMAQPTPGIVAAWRMAGTVGLVVGSVTTTTRAREDDDAERDF
jgi:hypothetical protein